MSLRQSISLLRPLALQSHMCGCGMSPGVWLLVWHNSSERPGELESPVAALARAGERQAMLRGRNAAGYGRGAGGLLRALENKP